MTRVRLAGLCVALGCATRPQHLEETSPRFAELAPRRIAVVVAGEPPRDAQVRIDRFGLRYPDPIGPDTRLPDDAGLARDISRRLADGLVSRLRARGYQAEALSAPGARVGDLLRRETHDAVLVVVYRAASRWPVSEYQRTEIRQVGSLQEEVSQYLYVIERGLLILPTAHLLDARTSLRLWSRSNLGLQSDRVAMDDPVRKLGVVTEPDRDTPPFEQLLPGATDAVLSFYFDSLPGAPASRPPPDASRQADLREQAAVDRWRLHPRLVLDAGGGYARRSLPITTTAGSVELDGDGAFGGFWDLELGLRALGRRWMHGPRLALQRSGADYRRTILTTTSAGLEFSEASLRAATAIDVTYTLARAWQPRRALLLAAGGGPAVTVVVVDGEPVESATRVQLGPVAEIEASWAAEAMLAGPFLRAGWMFDVSEAGSGPSLAAGVRLGVTF